MIRRKMFTKVFTVLMIALGGWFIFTLFLSPGYSFMVSSEKDAQISVSTAKNEAFKIIGVGNAEYTTRQTEPVYVRAVKGGSVTMRTVFPADSDGKVIELVLSEPKKPTVLVKTPITSPLSEKGVFYGINSLTHTMVAVALDGHAPLKLSYISVPYVDSLIWLDSDNYHYNIFGGGVGTVIDDNNKDKLFLLNKLAWGEEVAKKVSKFGTKPLVLLTSKSLYTSDDFGKSLHEIASVESDEHYFLGTGAKYIYYVDNLPPGEYTAEEDGMGEGSGSAFSSELTLYDYQGNTILRTSLLGFPVVVDVSFHSQSSSVFVAGKKGLLQLDKSGEATRVFDFPFTLHDIVPHENAIYLFSNQGVWLLDLASESYSLVYDPGFNTYIAGSAQLNKTGDRIFFTTANSPTNSGALYQLNL